MRARFRPWLGLVGWAWLGACSNDAAEPGEGWREAFAARDVGWLLSVWGPAADDLYAVGGRPDDGVVMHFDGLEWTAVDLGVRVPLLNWVFGFSSADVTVVGNDGTILHFDGAAWTTESTTVSQDLWGVWGVSRDDLWAVGGNGRSEGQATLLRREAGAWRRMPTPALSRPNVNAFFKVWGTSSDNVYAVGQRGAIVRFDGNAWTEQLSGTGDDLIALWGTGPDRVVVVGGRNNGQVVVFDGDRWTHRSLSPLPGLNGVWMRRPDIAHVAGANGTLARLRLENFTVEEALVEPRVTDDFHAVFGAPGGRLISVGGSLIRPTAPYRGLAYERELSDEE